MTGDPSMMAEALLWACGLSAERPAPQLVAGSQFRELVTLHKIAGRLLNRLESAELDADWKPILSRCDDWYRQDMATADRIEHELRLLVDEVERNPKWDGSPLVLLKGNSASNFLPAGRRRRATYDLDILPRDPDLYVSIFEAQGYRPTGWYFCHEAANLTATGRYEIDLHRYFPAWRYPGAPYRQVAADGAELRMTDWVRSERLAYDTILASSMPYPKIATGTARMPGLTMTAFILCLHIFHDFVAPALSLPAAKVRLIELCELSELWAHPSFDLGYFNKLVDDHIAHDAFALSCQLLGEAGLPLGRMRGAGSSGRSSYPQEIGFGLLIDARTSFSDLLVRRDTFGSVFDILPAAEVALGEGPQVISTRAAADGAARKPKSITFRSSPARHAQRDSGDFDFTCEIFRRGDSVVFAMTAAGEPGVFFDEFVLFFGNEVVHAAYDVYRSGFRGPPGESGCHADWSIGGDSWTVTVRVPVAMMDRHRADSSRIPVIVQAGRFLERLTDSWDAFYRRSVSSACIPLWIRLDRAAGS